MSLIVFEHWRVLKPVGIIISDCGEEGGKKESCRTIESVVLVVVGKRGEMRHAL